MGWTCNEQLAKFPNNIFMIEQEWLDLTVNLSNSPTNDMSMVVLKITRGVGGADIVMGETSKVNDAILIIDLEHAGSSTNFPDYVLDDTKGPPFSQLQNIIGLTEEPQ